MATSIQKPPLRIPPPVPRSPFSDQAAAATPAGAAAAAPPTPPPTPAPAAPAARPGWQRVLTAVCAATLEGLGQCMEQEGEQLQAQSAMMAAPPAKPRRACCCFGRRK